MTANLEGAISKSYSRIPLRECVEGTKATCRRLGNKVADGAKATDKVIRQHPYQSVGIAIGLGLVIGLLAGRR